jgi:long-chain acyl-CoA synthetase
VELKLVDYPEAGYYSTNSPPQGEVWIRGDPVTRGYYDNEEETALACRPDGWFLTGDIGQFEPNGHVKIIDRKKNLVKTLNGEYIALEKLESVYRASSYVANICVYAAEDRNKPVAVIVPAEPAVKKLASTNSISGDSIEELAKNDRLVKLVLQDLQKIGKQAGLTGIEILEAIVFDTEEWTPQNVSPTTLLITHIRYLLIY